MREFDGKGMYRVFSDKGEYTVEAGEQGKESTQNHKRPLPGTLIEWRLELNED